MKLPKTIYVKVEGDDKDSWLSASANKNEQVEADGDIIGTYILQKRERGKPVVEFTDIK